MEPSFGNSTPTGMDCQRVAPQVHVKAAIMDSSQYDGGSSRRYGGFSVAVLAHTMKSIVNQEVPVKILDEKVPPPPPPPELSLLPPPNLVTPPPPFIPPPEGPVQQPLVNPIAVTTAITPPAQPFAKTLATQPLAAPPAISHFPPVPAFADLNACKPVYPRASLLAEEVGTVRVEKFRCMAPCCQTGSLNKHPAEKMGESCQ